MGDSASGASGPTGGSIATTAGSSTGGSSSTATPGMGGQGSNISNYSSVGSLSDTFNKSQGVSSENTPTLNGSGGGENEEPEWKKKLRKALMAAGSAQLSDINAYSTPANGVQGVQEYNQNVNVGGGSNADIYNQLLQRQQMMGQQAQVKRYRNGV